ncbi:MAG: YifB family Mg chelatase-like AAA ATPase [Lachnospiraceae bacterium]|nr:YifB family Mg chelatase-like AAA ATPase [Lachnospiraceae bacterium]
MYNKAWSADLMGIEGFLVEVEVDIRDGLPCMELVGALGSEVKEARERVRAALYHIGFMIPPKRITVNLSPADRRKEGGGFDLPIAVAILQALGYIPDMGKKRMLFVGELGLDGGLRPVNGLLSLVHFAREQGFEACVVPKENAPEAALVQGIEIFALETLNDMVCFSKDAGSFLYHGQEDMCVRESGKEKDFSDLVGQETLKRAAEVAAAGMHHLLMIGPPGAGKTMVAERLPGILPDISREEQLELTKIYSVRGLLERDAPLVKNRPFRALHHTVPVAALIGGGQLPKPGEISLAHRGVLFLDELPEFSRTALEALRQPMESGEIVVSRMYGAFHFPADFMVVAGMNPCPCGYYPDRTRCVCDPGEIARYQKRVSRPFLDRMDLCVEVAKVPYEQIREHTGGESSAQIKERVERARKIQEKRFAKEAFRFNAGIPAKRIEQYCPLEEEGKHLMHQVYERLGLSVRSYHKVLKVARTIADLDGSENIGKKHLSEAISYRPMAMQVQH